MTFDTTKKALVVHDGVTAGGKAIEGFLVLNPGNVLVSQVVQGILSVTGGDDDSTAFSVVNGAAFNDVTINETASIRRLHMHQEVLAYASNIVLNFGAFGSKRITLAGNVMFSASGFGYGSYLNLKILCDGSARTLTFPAGWKFVGSAVPTSIAANKTALLHLWVFGLADTDIVAQYIVEP